MSEEEGGDALLWHPWEFGRGLRNESDYPTLLPIAVCRYTRITGFSAWFSLSPRGHSPLSPIYTHCCNLSVPLSSLTSTIPSSLILSSFHAYLNINDQPVTIFLLYLTSSSSSIHSNAFIIVPFSSNSSYVSSQYSLILLYFSLSMFISWSTYPLTIIFLLVCLFFSISSNVHDVSMRFFSLDFLPLTRMRLLGEEGRGRSPGKIARITDPLGRGSADGSVTDPAHQKPENLPTWRKYVWGSSSPSTSILSEHNVGGGGIVMESTLRVLRLNHFPMAELTSLRGWFLPSSFSSFFLFGKEEREG